MERKLKHKLVAGGAAALAVAGGGGALAATQLGSPNDASKAIVADAAGQLGISPDRLSAALKAAIEKQVDAAVASGRLTKEQGDALKARIEAQDYPLLGLGLGRPGFGPGLGLGHGDLLDTAASYLGVTEEQLRSELAGGKTLAQAAKDHGKTADGLVSALVAAEKKRVESAVSAGRLTRAQADTIEAGLEQRMTELVNGALRGPRRGFEHGFGFRGVPPEGRPAFRGTTA
jgi:hypothetical protein